MWLKILFQISNYLWGQGPHLTQCDNMSLNSTGVLAKWHLNPSDSLSIGQGCDRQTDDRRANLPNGNTCIIALRCRMNIASRIERCSCALVTGRSGEVVGGTADVEKARRVDDKQRSIGGAGTTNDRPLILCRWMRVAAARQSAVHAGVLVHSPQPLSTRTIW